VPDYGLHDLFVGAFPDMPVPDVTARRKRVRENAEGSSRSTRPGRIAQERLSPIEIIGEPTPPPRGGVVYVLKSKYGYKVGRTNNIPARMRAFGVLLPFIYTIELCAWFDDAVVAERRYHDLFRDKRLQGEWFELEEQDIQRIRMREMA